jgi:hypothetical protein
MAYLKPPWFTAKVFNKIAMATGVSGTETLTVTARSSGQQQRIPVITVDVDDARHLVSTRGESQWVKNVRANPVVILDTKVGAVRFTAVEVPVADRPPVLQAYRVKAGKTVDGYFAKLPDPADHPVFRLEPV